MHDCNIACQLLRPTHIVTTCQPLRLYKKHVRYDLRKYYFGNRIACIWNSLPEYVINANKIGAFENRLDPFRSDKACYYEYKADLTGNGSRSQL